MDSTKKTYATFPFEWTVKSTSYQIRYRKAIGINEIDEIFCSIIHAKGNEIAFSELAILLGFNLQDLAEIDILNFYIKSLTEYDLIDINQEKIQLTDGGQRALQSKLKYKYYFATTELFENQTATGEKFSFSFNDVFELENVISHEKEITKETFKDPKLKQKLEFQLFGNDIYSGEIIEFYKAIPKLRYKSIAMQCEISGIDDSLQLFIYKSHLNKPELQFLIDLTENQELKSKLIRIGRYHHILSEKDSITVQDIEIYIDLWNWTELAKNPKVDWDDKTIFKLFLENGDGSVWCVISEKIPIEKIKSVLQQYAEFWNWTELTKRFDNDFIKENIGKFNWDFEELSYKDTEFVISLLSNPTLKDCSWDWNYLSKNLSDDFIESNIDEFPWDYYLITEVKSEILRNLLRKKGKGDYTNVLLSKSWNWKFISTNFDENFLYNHISLLATNVDWPIVLEKFFNNEEITTKCLKEETFLSLLKQHLPDNFVVAHQKYLWKLNLIDFFEQQNQIQWESKTYINGFDTNENVEWDKTIFKKYHSRISTEKGFLNVSQQISDFNLIEEFPDFDWNWEGISNNRNFLSDPKFIKKAFLGEYYFSANLNWAKILNSITSIDFINRHLDTFYKTVKNTQSVLFWKQLTKIEDQNFIFGNLDFPWDWSFITENSTDATILGSFDDKYLFEKWDWKIATRKLDKATILEYLEVLSKYIDWKYLINQVFTLENELSIDKHLDRIAYCLLSVTIEIRKDIWKDLTTKFQFETLFPMIKATYHFDVYEWDWDFIANHKFFPTDISTLNQFRQKINWSILSQSNAIQKKFNPNSWNSSKEWLSNIDRYLQIFEDKWDWNVLSQNRNINCNRLLLQKYKGGNWDWDYLTEFGGFLTKQKNDNEKYVEQLLKQFPKIKFEILSKRKDISIHKDLILSNRGKNWDWQILSENENAEISNDLIFELKHKNWNWKAISKHKGIEFTNEILLQIPEKDWDWNYLSENANLEFNIEFIEKTKEKSWNWKAVSRHKSFLPTIELLTVTKDFDLDWEYISQNSSLNPTKELLSKFEAKWDWNSITQNPQINFSDIAFTECFADKWNWRFICESGKLTLNNQILSQFKEHLKWDLISANTNINLTKEIIQEYKQYWNWKVLKENKRVEELLGNYVADEISKSANLNFIDKIEQQNSRWKGSIYHFSHIDNAVQIIRERKIKSRNTANQFSDSAGNVVYSRTNAHNYARFYFRPHTQTQFYNEYLGIDINMGFEKGGQWHSWYEKEYRMLDFPKCPKPIYLKFSLQEVLFANYDKCNISTGNMQRNKTKYGKIANMIQSFNFQDLFINPQMDSEEWKKFSEYAQQEFLIEKELDFSSLNYFKIICANEYDKALLIKLLGEESIEVIKNIVVDHTYYRNENPPIHTDIKNKNLIISTNKQAEGYFVLLCDNVSLLDIISGDVIKKEKNKVTFKSFIEIFNAANINIIAKYIDEINQEWFICSNYELMKREYDDIRVKTIERKQLRVGQLNKYIF